LTILPYKIIVALAQGSVVDIPSNLFSQVYKVAKEGKLLSLLCNYIENVPEEFRLYLEKRCLLTEFYSEYLRIIAEELSSEGLEYYIFKTVKSFAYDITDLDLLFIDRKEMLSASKLLIERHKFKPISKGTYSISLRKTVKSLDVDLDLQTKIAAGIFEYIVISDIKKRLGGEIGYMKNGLNLLCPELELGVIVGHAFYKDFQISLANILHSTYLLRTINKAVVKVIFANYPYLIRPIKMLSLLTNLLQMTLHNNENSLTRKHHGSTEYAPLIKSFYKSITNYNGHFNIPLILSMDVYRETIYMLVKRRQYSQLKEIARLPQSRGISQVLRRIKVLPPEEPFRV